MNGFGMTGGMWLVWIIAGVIVITLVVWLVRTVGREAGGPRERSPKQVLKDRFARGKIDEEEYRRKLEELRC